jgi:hypothetical protein
MCLGGGGSSYEYKEPKKFVWESAYEGPAPNTVNNKIIGEEGSFSQEATKGEKPKRARLKPVKQSEKIVS